MASHLVRLFKQRRFDQNLTVGELARKCGYKNITSGANRIARWEQNGTIHPQLLWTLAEALGISDAEVQQCFDKMQADWEAWAKTPIEPYIVGRPLAAVYFHYAIPEEHRTSQEAMEAYTAALVRERHFEHCLIVSRRDRVWFYPDGSRRAGRTPSFDKTIAPYMQIGGKKFLLNFRNDGSLGSVIQ